ncbi:MAG: hypothetical protein ABR541_04890 [Candidatus Dormibacteria bacterium]
MTAVPLTSRVQPVSPTALARRFCGSDLAIARLALPFVAALAISRRPTTLLSPQFYAEDGADTYASAYNRGLDSLTQPIAGYWQALNRLLGLLASQLPLTAAATFFAVVGIACALLPVAILLWSSRARTVVADARLRVGLAITYVCIQPPELRFSVTNAQWHLVVAALLVVLLPRASGRGGRATDLTVVALTATSGPLGLALVPPAAVEVWRRRDRRSLAVLALLVAGSAIEIGTYLTVTRRGVDARHSGDSGASLRALPELIASRVFVSFSGGPGVPLGGVAGIALVVVVGTFVVIAALWQGPRLLRWLLVVGGFALSIGLTHPYAALGGSHTAWYAMLHQDAYQRYFFLADLAWTGALVWLASRVRRQRALACTAVLLIGLWFSAGDWTDRVLPAPHLDGQQARLDAAVPGSAVVIPITPERWQMRLVRH